MSYRTIAVHVNASRHAKERIALAARVAAENDAHLIGVAAIGLPPVLYSEGMFPGGAPVLDACLTYMKEHADQALADFEQIADRNGVRSFEKRIIEDEAGEAMCLQARYSDLVIVGQSDTSETVAGERQDVAEYTLLNSGRPVLIVPYANDSREFGERAVIAWDGSLAAARAVNGALPLLRATRLVQVVIYDAEISLLAHGEEPGADIAAFLARHGINVDVSRQRTTQDIDVANALLSHVSDFGAGLIVMGGYGRSRLREVLMGGTTRTVLRSMTVPVMISH
ncbi:universal stress protein [Noviherbaspirillum sp. CPCC 100848]|uniref:Universal stress protein n=1 Tax=Noviherbaspirillum album TaxID=3080276 RepID=A0ABU6JHH2_9BURK|nr:universal stress protein [Noviherbaspirillum sp. CPCC 100848]MEC4723113.1 universal stress protein [Noviherbaspirillum sp. CPCC 100848]